MVRANVPVETPNGALDRCDERVLDEEAFQTWVSVELKCSAPVGLDEIIMDGENKGGNSWRPGICEIRELLDGQFRFLSEHFHKLDASITTARKWCGKECRVPEGIIAQLARDCGGSVVEVTPGSFAKRRMVRNG
jgi:hypothetical protein